MYSKMNYISMYVVQNVCIHAVLMLNTFPNKSFILRTNRIVLLWIVLPYISQVPKSLPSKNVWKIEGVMWYVVKQGFGMTEERNDGSAQSHLPQVTRSVSLGNPGN